MSNPAAAGIEERWTRLVIEGESFLDNWTRFTDGEDFSRRFASPASDDRDLVALTERYYERTANLIIELTEESLKLFGVQEGDVARLRDEGEGTRTIIKAAERLKLISDSVATELQEARLSRNKLGHNYTHVAGTEIWTGMESLNKILDAWTKTYVSLCAAKGVRLDNPEFGDRGVIS
ncbi:MAG: hypothetical protein ABI334_08545 [Candidatus Dormiibacterota bacterium]